MYIFYIYMCYEIIIHIKVLYYKISKKFILFKKFIEDITFKDKQPLNQRHFQNLFFL